jgi:hypothetical protein
LQEVVELSHKKENKDLAGAALPERGAIVFGETSGILDWVKGPLSFRKRTAHEEVELTIV